MFSLSIHLSHLSTGIQVVSVSWLLWMVLLWTLGCMCLFELEFLSFPDICSRVGLLDHAVTLFLDFAKISQLKIDFTCKVVKIDFMTENRSVVSYSLRSYGLYSPWNSPGHNTGVGSLSLLQGSSQPRDQKQVLSHCRRILYQLSHQGSLKILEWEACSSSSRSSWPRNRTGVSCIAGGFFTNWALYFFCIVAARIYILPYTNTQILSVKVIDHLYIHVSTLRLRYETFLVPLWPSLHRLSV